MKIHLGKTIGFCMFVGLTFFSAKAQDKPAAIEITLDRAIEIALSENPTVKVADLEIEKKKYAKKSNQSALYPQIDLVGNYSRAIKKQVMYMGGDDSGGSSMFDPIIKGIEDTFTESVPGYTPNSLLQNIGKNSTQGGDGGIEVGRDNTWTGGVSASWPIIVPTLWKSLQLSSIDVELAVENARASKINMVNSIRKAFYGALLAKDVLNVYKQSYDNALFNYNNIKSKFEQGIVSEYDMIRADVNAKNIKPNLVQSENAYTLSKLSLKALMGIDIDQEIEIEGSLADYEKELYQEVLAMDTTLTRNSDLKQFDIQTEQLNKSLEIYKAQYLPVISLSGNYMYMSMNNDFKFGDYKWTPYSTVEVAISIPIFDGLKKRNDIKQTKVSLEQMKWQREDIVRNLKLSVNNDINNMTNYVEQVFSTKDVVVQAQKGYEISKKLYDTGMGTLLDMNDAQLGLTQASLAFNQAIYNFLASKSDLDKTLGIDPGIIMDNNK